MANNFMNYLSKACMLFLLGTSFYPSFGYAKAKFVCVYRCKNDQMVQALTKTKCFKDASCPALDKSNPIYKSCQKMDALCIIR